MKKHQSLSHCKEWIHGQLCRPIGEVFDEFAEQHGCRIVEGHLMLDHVHICLRVPLEYAYRLGGYLKGARA